MLTAEEGQGHGFGTYGTSLVGFDAGLTGFGLCFCSWEPVTASLRKFVSVKMHSEHKYEPHLQILCAAGK